MAGCARDVVSPLVGARDGGCGELQALLDAVQTSSNDGGHRKVGVHIGTRATGFQASGFGAACNDPETCGAVVHAPGGFDGRPKAIHQAFVAVDGGPEHGRKFHQASHLAGEVAFKERAHLALAFGVEEKVAFAVRQTLMNVPRAARQMLVPLGHEAGHDAKPLADFFRAGFKKNGAIGLLQGTAKGDGHLVHTGSGLGVQTFDGHFEGRHVVKQRVEKFPLVAHAQERIAKHARCDGRGRHALFVGPGVGCLGKVEPLELHARHGHEAHLLGACQNAL